MTTHYQQRSRNPAERRKKIRMKQVQEAIQCRDKHFPLGISLISFGIIFIFLRILIGSYSTDITNGEIANTGGILGPFETTSPKLQALKIEYNLKGLGSKWCNLSILLLDENKNYLTGCNKDLYHEVDMWGDSSHEEDMEYLLNINNPGTYYYQFITKHQQPNFRLGQIHYNLSEKGFGVNYFSSFAILLLVVGIPYLIWTIKDWELTSYLPELKSAKSKKKIKTVSIYLIPLVVVIVLMSLFKIGYADLQNAPSSNFDHKDTHYFGK